MGHSPEESNDARLGEKKGEEASLRGRLAKVQKQKRGHSLSPPMQDNAPLVKPEVSPIRRATPEESLPFAPTIPPSARRKRRIDPRSSLDLQQSPPTKAPKISSQTPSKELSLSEVDPEPAWTLGAPEDLPERETNNLSEQGSSSLHTESTSLVSKVPPSKSEPRKAKKSWIKRIIKWSIILGILGILCGAGVFAGGIWYYSQDLPEIFERSDFNPKQSTFIYDREGNLLLELAEQHRTVIAYEEISELLKQAIVSAEDGNFFEHKGLDTLGVLRAMYTNIKQGGFSQGASTLTQQLVKNLILTPERTIKRKVQEVLLSRQLEQAFSKEDILWMYLNYVYFGHGKYGVEAASQHYFGKSAAALNLGEAATIAGLVQSPERLSPFKHPKRSRSRRDYVLRQMWKRGHIDEASYKKTLEEEIKLRQTSAPHLKSAPHFVEHVRRQLVERYGKDLLYTAGWKIHTTIDLRAQEIAQDALRAKLIEFDVRQGFFHPITGRLLKRLRKKAKRSKSKVSLVKVLEVHEEYLLVQKEGEPAGVLFPEPLRRVNPEKKPLKELFSVDDVLRAKRGTGKVSKKKTSKKEEKGEDSKVHKIRYIFEKSSDAALISIDPKTREVIALVGGFDYEGSSFNRAIQAKRQTGSCFKPIVFAAALEQRLITPATIIPDSPESFHIPGRDRPWSPRNFDSKFKGPMSARKALAKSRNTVAVKILDRLKIRPAIRFAQAIGVESKLAENYTMALGSSEASVMEMTNAFATFAAKGMFSEPLFVTRIETSTGKILDLERVPARRATSPEVAYLITSMMRSVATEGTARKHLRKWPHRAVGKTGTTNGPRDAWFIGYTPKLVTGVYVGFDKPQDLGKGEGGGKTALPIWATFMKETHEGHEPQEYEVPLGIEIVKIAPETGKRSREGFKKPRAEYFLIGTAPVDVALGAGEVDTQGDTMEEIGNLGKDPLLLPKSTDSAGPSNINDDDDGF